VGLPEVNPLSWQYVKIKRSSDYQGIQSVHW
jgi:hypothetical protein